MKKIMAVILLGVLVLSFVGTVMATNSEAAAPKCRSYEDICTKQMYPDGSVYVCCWVWTWIKGECILVEQPCYWEYPPI